MENLLGRFGLKDRSRLTALNRGEKISFAEVQRATNNFDDEKLLSEGGLLGNVYRGTLLDGRKVAVKRAKKGSRQSLPEFHTEIKILSKIHHRHLVSLIGYCDEKSEMIIVYEFMENGTLSDHLYASDFPRMPWKQRLKICIGAARGLDYLHTVAAGGIIHRDVKSNSILLDENNVAKVADFGLSKHGSVDETHVVTKVKGTRGYLDPDYLMSEHLSEKSDVYSFGVVLLEVLCGRPPICTDLPRNEINLAEWVLHCKTEGLLEQVVDSSLEGQIDANSLRVFSDAAEKCLQKDSCDRPTMGNVLSDLEYSLNLHLALKHRKSFEDSTANASKSHGNAKVQLTAIRGVKISFAEVQRATNNFDDEKLLGEGGFGNVYRGTLLDGRKVAVKRAKKGSAQGLPEFHTEIKILSQIHHRHLVSLIGYCDEKSEMIIVYELMENGTLSDHLYASDFPRMPWKQRLKICIGAARGLDYLHTVADGGIIHRDVKSNNILLDENNVAKVADFGLSKHGSVDETHVVTEVKGTRGYLDPDYAMSERLSEKSDVYSFGVVLLEVLCGRPPIDRDLPRDEISLAEWVLHCKTKGLLEQVVDSSLEGQIDANSLRVFSDTAEKCLRKDPNDRPTMANVLSDLEYALKLHPALNHRESFEDSTANASKSHGNGKVQLTVRDVAKEELMECLEILNTMEDLDGDSYSKVLKLLHGDVTWRSMFLLMPDRRKKEFIDSL